MLVEAVVFNSLIGDQRRPVLLPLCGMMQELCSRCMTPSIYTVQMTFFFFYTFFNIHCTKYLLSCWLFHREAANRVALQKR